MGGGGGNQRFGGWGGYPRAPPLYETLVSECTYILNTIEPQELRNPQETRVFISLKRS